MLGQPEKKIITAEAIISASIKVKNIFLCINIICSTVLPVHLEGEYRQATVSFCEVFYPVNLNSSAFSSRNN